jgi:hypothetical protein
MIQTAVQAGNDQRINLFKIFEEAKKIRIGRDIFGLFSQKAKPSNPILKWFEKSTVLVPLELTMLPASALIKDRAIIKFKLSDSYRDQFALLRGLLAFHTVKEISVVSNASERTFEVGVNKDQIKTATTHLDTIINLLNKELSFKKSLKALLKFEEATKEKQSKLYQALRDSLH